MNAPTKTAIAAAELDELLNGDNPPRVVDVRTPAEFETAHIPGSHNVPLDVLRKHRSEISEHLTDEVVLLCKSGQRSSQAEELLRGVGITGTRVLEKGFSDWENKGLAVERGRQRWDLERQVRMVAGSIVLSAVLGSVAAPKLKWLAGAIGAGLTFAAVSDTCAMGTALSKLPYNRGAEAPDVRTIVAQLR
ncbi:rhodanese-like domain-containing protein [Mycobacterium bourgelatii]|uniref:Sulfurtransferase n=1 Tax=Mycobacterium bourgelatii TaxID=1273442 RepID=A0A7I9YS27_MYCBU|nr:rhodanese-like domain-containing protein [Mycobacterium bourgelatii]MCV6974186.1 rhodanese-like domain-containing protein [Mycobacterium bourgelatii]GFG91357.1 sulfurtransferase [Mycobacterium bourgelatii]